MVRYIISAAVLAVCATNVAGASTITLTSGSVSAGSNTTTLASGAIGTFSATDSRSDLVFFTPDGQSRIEQVSSATVTAQISSSALSLDAVSNGSTYAQAPSGVFLNSRLLNQGSLAFDVGALTTFDYSTNSPWFSSETLKDSHGTTLLSITCQYIGFDCTSGTTFSGNLTLGPGSYTLSFENEAAQQAGNTFNSHMTFSLQPVPLPAAAWVLVSGLLPLFSLGKRGRRALA